MENRANYQLTLNNFELDESFKKVFIEKISSLLDVSPSDAGAHSNLTKTKTGYLGVLEIISSQGKFAVETVGSDLENMVKSLFQLMHQQMNNWRSLRFQD
jgi:hypothetical protein